ncbi:MULTISPECIES: NUDIX domain-containing protein [Comamonas]|uniref:NUDIX hydrolase n=1 Tax=Comamonas TaxID=283 RepID=UPI0007C4B1FE|nr:NUDIX domain-containing protein [Comamonas thiooxydans]MCO8251995.1 NUDIX domain-containing protein [Comamonas thiooxydans]OAD85833.1 DNA mismatch repair protein MutT [Comamonas thiooxydans]UBQ39859.1 NUDIX domain-containing protein [Comamonas thiooxydans]
MRSETPLRPSKACPVVIRGQGSIEILAFEHPLAGLQLVKGTIEPGENSREAALRELREESGLEASEVLLDLGIWASGYEDQIWAFHLCDVRHSPESWTHQTSDDGGHDFKFFWHPLAQPPNERWHWVFQGALKYIASKLSA